MHRDWCGAVCADCEKSGSCYADLSSYCSPDCPNIGPDGEFTEACNGCSILAEFEDDDPIEGLYAYSKEEEIWY